MQIGKNKTISIAISILFIFSMTASIMLIPSANAHTPAWTIPTYAFITVSPSPVGVGQQAYVIMWLDKLYDNTLTVNNYRFHDYQLVITAPDGTNTTESFPVVQDTTSAQDYAFTPNTVGTYKLTFTFPGQTLTLANDANSEATLFGPPTFPNPYINDTYAPSTASTTLTVQSSPIAGATASGPLPTAYWTRPIYGENSYWYTLASNWLGTGSPGYAGWGGTSNQQSFPGDAVGSLTSHIMWTKQYQSGGVVGGNTVAIPANTYFEGSAYSQRYTNPIIVDGMLIYTNAIGWSGVAGGTGSQGYGATTCVDLQTGQTLWTNPTMKALSFAYIYDAEDPNQHGVWPPVLISSTASNGGIFGAGPGNWYAYDAFTGISIFNITNVPGGATMLGPSGEFLVDDIVSYGPITMGPFGPAHSGAPYYLQEWNSSKLWDSTYSGASTVPGLIPTYTDGSNPALLDFNVSIPSLTAAPTIQDAFYNKMLIVSTGTFPGGPFETFSSDSWTPYTYYGISVAAGSVGNVLWTNTITPPAGNITVEPGPADITANGGKGVFTEGYKETTQWVGYSMATGQKLWGPTAPMASLDYYGNPAIPIIGGVVANGILYSTGYAGILYAWDVTTGNLLWTWGNGPEGSTNSSYAGFNTPFGVYPMQINAIGDGVVYMVTTEHTIETPLFKGGVNVAINATTGQEIWSLSGYTGEFFTTSYAMADGYNTWFNGYDNSIYVVGRGPSQTTVSAPNVATTVGVPVVIRGSVVDIAAGTQGTQQKGDFPNGVPCASDASMQAWMGYVYQQQGMPANFTGVKVQIAVLDSNGNHYPVGTVTTDASGMYTLSYTPTIAGNFTVFATFAGTNGYWPSSAETSFVATGAHATEAPTATPLTGVASESTVEYVGIAIIIVIIIIGAVLALLMMRKHA
ncbi:MAG: PQQ-binding-like beta-propeller repeat protein [Candidatus Bathyarchaeia archaeon]|jgi:hypothetical protein